MYFWTERFDDEICGILATFSECLKPLILTHKLLVKGSLIFLDLRLHCYPSHMCWLYEPKGNEPLLSYSSSSAHSILVKREIINICFKNALHKSCFHLVKDSFKNQVLRLVATGYPSHLVTAIAETLLKRRRIKNNKKAKRK